jgi:hypothetical protein
VSVVKRRRARASALTLTLLAAAVTAAAAASAPAPPQLSLVMTPAIIDAKATGPGALPAIALSNRGKVELQLTVFPALAAQAPEGGLKLIRGRRSDALARRIVRLAAPRRIGPGATVEVRLSFRSYAGRRSASIAAVMVAVPLKQPRSGIRYRVNLLGTVFVHRPQAIAHPAIERVLVSRLGKVRRQLTVRVRNRGDAPAFITGVRFRVLNAQGKMVASVKGPPGFIVPRSVRDFGAVLFRRLPAGRVRVEAIVQAGTQEIRRSAVLASR